MEQKQTKTSKIIVLLLAIMVIVVSIAFYMQKQRADDLLTELNKSNSDKTEVTAELQEMLAQYEGLKSDNDTLNKHLNKEQAKIKKLLKEIKRVKYSNKFALKEYKRETETLRKIMRSYIVQIDSLNTLNQNLVAENKQVKSQYEAVNEEKNTLLQVTDSLSGKVAEAQQLLVGNLFITGLNKRDRETNKIARIVKFKTCFQVKENKVAKEGAHQAYIRISMPDKSILYKSNEDLFDYQGEKIVYTAARQFDYQGKEMNLCVYYKHQTPPLVRGNYHVDIFIDGIRTNSASFELR